MKALLGLVCDSGSSRVSLGRVAFWLTFAPFLYMLVSAGDVATLERVVWVLLGYASGTKVADAVKTIRG